MGAISEFSAHVTPPRRGQVLALSVDSTSRSYDITPLAMGGFTPSAADVLPNEVFVCVFAEGADVYIQFDSASSTVDDTAAVAAGGTLAFGNTHCVKVEQGTAAMRFRLNRVVDKFMTVKTSAGTGTLRLWVTSPAI